MKVLDLDGEPLKEGDRVYHIDGWMGVFERAETETDVYVTADNGTYYGANVKRLLRVRSDTPKELAAILCAKKLWRKVNG